jgi:hypothetical protein
MELMVNVLSREIQEISAESKSDNRADHVARLTRCCRNVTGKLQGWRARQKDLKKYFSLFEVKRRTELVDWSANVTGFLRISVWRRPNGLQQYVFI